MLRIVSLALPLVVFSFGLSRQMSAEDSKAGGKLMLFEPVLAVPEAAAAALAVDSEVRLGTITTGTLLANGRKTFPAFTRVPTPRPLPPATPPAVGPDDDRNGAELSSPLVAAEPWSGPPFVFPEAARFSVREFGLAGQAIAGTSLIIYEGMEVRYCHSGEYGVRFVAQAPAVPVVLRLQLTGVACDTGESVTLTLPPITIRPGGRQEDAAPTEQLVEHRGFSHRLGTMLEWNRSLEFFRSGNARFGFGKPID